MHSVSRRIALAALSAALSTPAFAGDRAGPERPSEAWADLRHTLYGDRVVEDGSKIIEIDAPYRAHDAAAVPIEIDIAPPLGRIVERFAVVIDQNPAPVAARVEVGPGMGRTVDFATRVRIDAYSNLRVVAELDDGTLMQRAVFVKASGGCSAPASNRDDEAVAAAGRMKLRAFDRGDPEAQLLLRHPNHSGFQIDQVTLLNIPAWFVDEIELRQGEELVFRVAGGISLSEDPALRFGYAPNGAATFEARVADTDGNVWEAAFPIAGG